MNYYETSFIDFIYGTCIKGLLWRIVLFYHLVKVSLFFYYIHRQRELLILQTQFWYVWNKTGYDLCPWHRFVDLYKTCQYPFVILMGKVLTLVFIELQLFTESSCTIRRNKNKLWSCLKAVKYKTEQTITE